MATKVVTVGLSLCASFIIIQQLWDIEMKNEFPNVILIVRKQSSGKLIKRRSFSLNFGSNSLEDLFKDIKRYSDCKNYVQERDFGLRACIIRPLSPVKPWKMNKFYWLSSCTEVCLYHFWLMNGSLTVSWSNIALLLLITMVHIFRVNMTLKHFKDNLRWYLADVVLIHN